MHTLPVTAPVTTAPVAHLHWVVATLVALQRGLVALVQESVAAIALEALSASLQLADPLSITHVLSAFAVYAL